MIILPHLGKEYYPKSQLHNLVASYWMNTTLIGCRIVRQQIIDLNRVQKQILTLKSLHLVSVHDAIESSTEPPMRTNFRSHPSINMPSRNSSPTK